MLKLGDSPREKDIEKLSDFLSSRLQESNLAAMTPEVILNDLTDGETKKEDLRRILDQSGRFKKHNLSFEVYVPEAQSSQFSSKYDYLIEKRNRTEIISEKILNAAIVGLMLPIGLIAAVFFGLLVLKDKIKDRI